ncbi:MAG: hypothetical protein DRJ01_16925, partial [Bacteroidetes bacterium]
FYLLFSTTRWNRRGSGLVLRAAAGDMIFDTIDKIELNPLIFQICEELPTKTNIYRRAICSSWTIIFKVKDLQILILGIIHSSRKPSKIRKLKKVK